MLKRKRREDERREFRRNRPLSSPKALDCGDHETRRGSASWFFSGHGEGFMQARFAGAGT